ncbi:MAG: hypothetical protein WBY53_07520 [Acidobacteriaceae bacterium]
MIEGGSPQQTPAQRQPAPHRPQTLGFPPAPPPELKPIPRWIWISVACFLVVMSFLAIPVFRAARRQTRMGAGTVRTIHAAMRKQDDAVIFTEADGAYQQQVGRKKSDELFNWVRASLGAPHASTRIGTFGSASTKDGTILTLTYETRFDKGLGTETIQLHKVNGKYLLYGYTVKSPQMREQDVPADLKTN